MDQARRVAEQCAREVGLDPALLERQGNGSTSAVFLGGDTVFIVARPYADAHALEARVTLASLLSATGRFVRPLWPQPRLVAGRLVTAWARIDIRSGPVDWGSAGLALRTLHETPVDGISRRVPLRDVTTLTDVRSALARLTDETRIARRSAVLLGRVCDRLDDELTLLDRRRGIVHGDLHAPNLLNGTDGVVLCDTDEIAIGAPSYDLGLLMDPRRPAIPAESIGAFTAAYGEPLPPLPVRRSFARAAHLRRTVHLLGLSGRTVREHAYDRVRLGAWAAMQRDWDRDLVPVVSLPARLRAGLALRGAR